MIRTEKITPAWIYQLARFAGQGAEPLPVDVQKCKALIGLSSATYTYKRDIAPLYARVGDLFPAMMETRSASQSIHVEYHDTNRHKATFSEPWEFAENANPGKHTFDLVTYATFYATKVDDGMEYYYLVFYDAATADYYAAYTWHLNLNNLPSYPNR